MSVLKSRPCTDTQWVPSITTSSNSEATVGRGWHLLLKISLKLFTACPSCQVKQSSVLNVVYAVNTRLRLTNSRLAVVLIFSFHPDYGNLIIHPKCCDYVLLVQRTPGLPCSFCSWKIGVCFELPPVIPLTPTPHSSAFSGLSLTCLH